MKDHKDLDALDKIPLGEMLEGSEEVTVTPPSGGVKVTMALKIEKDVLRDLEIYARSIGEKPSTLARMLIKEGLMSRGANISLESIPEILRLKIAQSQSVLCEPSASWNVQKPLKSGEKAPKSRQYEIVGPRGGRTGEEKTVIKGEPLPPTPKKGQGYIIDGPSKSKAKSKSK